MSADLAIMPTLSANGYAKMTPAITPADAGDAFGQMLRGMQNVVSGGGLAVAAMPAAGSGAVVQEAASPGGSRPAAGSAGNQVTNAVTVATVSVATKPLAPAGVVVAQGAADQVAPAELLAVAQQVDARPVVGGVGVAQQAVVAALPLGPAAVVPVVADSPAGGPVAGVAAERPELAGQAADAQPAPSKHVKALPAGNAASEGQPAALVTAAVIVAIPGPQIVASFAVDGVHSPVSASVHAGDAAVPPLGVLSNEPMRAAKISIAGAGHGAGLVQAALANGVRFDVAAVPVGMGAVQNSLAGGAGVVPRVFNGPGAVGATSGAGGLSQGVPLASAEPSGRGVVSGDVVARDVVPRVATPVEVSSSLGSAGIVAQASTLNAEVGGLRVSRPESSGRVSGGAAIEVAPTAPFAGVGAAPAARIDGVEGTQFSGGAGRVDGDAVSGVVVAAASGAAATIRAASTPVASPVLDASAGRPGLVTPVASTARFEEAPTRVAEVVRDVFPVRSEQHGLDTDIGATVDVANRGSSAGVAPGVVNVGLSAGVAPRVGDVTSIVGVAASVANTGLGVDKPVQAATTRADGFSAAASTNSTGQTVLGPALVTAKPVQAALSVAAVPVSAVTTPVSVVVQVVSSDAATRPGRDAAGSGASLTETVSLGAAAGRNFASAGVTGDGRAASAETVARPSSGMTPAPDTTMVTAVAVEMAAPRADAPVQAAASPAAGMAQDAASPVLAPAPAATKAAPGSAAHVSTAVEAPLPAPADVSARNQPLLDAALSVTAPVAVEDFGVAAAAVAQAPAGQGVVRLTSGSGQAAADVLAGRPPSRATAADRHMQWLPAIEGVGTGGQPVSPLFALSTSVVSRTAGGGDAASTHGAAAMPVPAAVHGGGLPAPMAAAQAVAPAPGSVQAAAPMTADARAGGATAPVADHKITLRAADIQSDPVSVGAPSVTALEPIVSATAPSAPPVETPAAAAAQAPPARVPEPAEQVGPALLTLAKTTDGAHEMTVRMQPAELGMVQVKITRSDSGTTQIDITAEKTSTLLALQRDQPSLHRTLDEAGISAVGRTIVIHAAPAAPIASGDSGASLGGHAGGQQAGGQQAGGQQGQGGRANAGNADADGGGGGDRGSFPGGEPNSYATGRRSGVSSDLSVANANNASRAALDITA